MKYALCVLLSLALAACAPTFPVLVVSPDPGPAPQPQPASEIINERALTPRDGAGAIVVTSHGGARSAPGCIVDVALDDELVAGLLPGERVVLFAEPGARTVSLNVRDQSSCNPASAQVALDIVAHTTQRIELGSDSRHDLKVEVDAYGRSLPP